MIGKLGAAKDIKNRSKRELLIDPHTLLRLYNELLDDQNGSFNLYDNELSQDA